MQTSGCNRRKTLVLTTTGSWWHDGRFWKFALQLVTYIILFTARVLADGNEQYPGKIIVNSLILTWCFLRVWILSIISDFTILKTLKCTDMKSIFIVKSEITQFIQESSSLALNFKKITFMMLNIFPLTFT